MVDPIRLQTAIFVVRLERRFALVRAANASIGAVAIARRAQLAVKVFSSPSEPSVISFHSPHLQFSRTAVLRSR